MSNEGSIPKPRTYTLLNAVIATGAVAGQTLRRGRKTFFLSGTTSAGAGAASVKVQVSNDNTTWLDLGTISLTLATTASADGFISDDQWLFHRGNVISISGTDATVTLKVGA